MRFGPQETPEPGDHDEPDEPASSGTAAPHPGDIHVAGRKSEPPDWEPVQPRSETSPVPGPRAESQPLEGDEPPPAPEPPPVPEAPGEPLSEATWKAYEPQHASEPPAPPAPPPAPPPTPPPTSPSGGRGGLLAKEPPPTTPPSSTPPSDPSPSTTAPDVPQPQDVPDVQRPVGRTWAQPVRPAPEVSMADPSRRKALVDTFVSGFVDSTIWQATLAVLEGAFPGLGLAALLTRRADDLWRTMDTLADGGAAKLGLPAWLDDAGMVFDLSAHLNVPDEPASKPRASWPYAGAFVIDTLDPLRYHRAVGGPLAPRDQAQTRPQAGESDDTGVVIVADLARARVRVLDSAALWRYAGQIVVTTLYDPLRPESRVRTRRALRGLQRVVFIDPRLGLGLCLEVDVVRTPRCLLSFRVDSGAPRFVRP
ncbi:hypothetical protein ACGFNU_45270 [Spirillospora sp. NPDC048911]|uniref:hypothetical protein n=1 Tax=Spirillospora sp. NPDC048911 TaxID=3364527 RepID=UPI00371592DF